MQNNTRNIVSFCIMTLLVMSCNTNSKSQIDTKEENKNVDSKSITYSDEQLVLLEEHHKICIVFNGYRFFLKSLRESTNKDDYQVYVDNNWTEQQELLLSHSKSLTNLSTYLIEYKNQQSVSKQISLISDIENKINNHFKGEDKSIDWEVIMQKSIPPHYFE